MPSTQYQDYSPLHWQLDNAEKNETLRGVDSTKEIQMRHYQQQPTVLAPDNNQLGNQQQTPKKNALEANVHFCSYLLT